MSFFERDVLYYRDTSDLYAFLGGELIRYSSREKVQRKAQHTVAQANVAIVTSFCADGVAASKTVLGEAHALKDFLDLDMPLTLADLKEGRGALYLPLEELGRFDLVLSCTGAGGARRIARHPQCASCGAPLRTCGPRPGPSWAEAGDIPQRPFLSRQAGPWKSQRWAQGGDGLRGGEVCSWLHCDSGPRMGQGI